MAIEPMKTESVQKTKQSFCYPIPFNMVFMFILLLFSPLFFHPTVEAVECTYSRFRDNDWGLDWFEITNAESGCKFSGINGVTPIELGTEASNSAILMVPSGKTLTVDIGETLVVGQLKVNGIVQVNSTATSSAQIFIGGVTVNEDVDNDLYRSSRLKVVRTLGAGQTRPDYASALTFDCEDNFKDTDNVCVAKTATQGGSLTRTANTLFSGLVGQWHLNDGGATIADTSGFGNTGTPTGTTPVIGKVGIARSFNGTSDYIEKTSPTGQPIGNSATTIAGWIKIDSTGITQDKTVAFFGTDSAGATGYGLAVSSNYKAIAAGPSSTGKVTGGTTLSVNTWYHLTAVYDGNTNKIYVNGVEDGRVSYSSMNFSAGVMRIGAWHGYNSSYTWKGILDEVQIWNRALTQTEITALANTSPSVEAYNQPLDNNTPGLIGLWRLDESSGTGAYLKDSSPPNSSPFATGGTITYSGGYTIHTFTTSGTFTAGGSGNIEVLIVGGGGGGGGGRGGGGGGGGLVYHSSYAITPGDTTVTVGGGGAGGAGATYGNYGTNGGNSVFGSITALGGGGGGKNDVGGVSGGSGGGAGGGAGAGSGGAATQGASGGGTGYGYAGGANTTAAPYPCGGGGGAGGAGIQGVGSKGGDGGSGRAYSISGSSVSYAGGGGGGIQSSTPGYGQAGGGNGTAGEVVGGNATANTGSGGGGAGIYAAGGNGGSGIIIVRYPSTYVGISDGTPIGTTSTNGMFSKARRFNGTSDYISIPNSNSFDVNTLTISAWVYSSNFNHNGFIFEKGPVNTQYSCFFNNNDKFYFRTHNSAGTEDDLSLTTSSYIKNNQWNHIACVYDGGTKQIYVNGVLAASKAYNQILRTGQIGERIGAYISSSPSYFFNGSINEVAVFNRALSDSEIQQIAQRRPDGYAVSDVIDMGTSKLEKRINWNPAGTRTNDGETPYSNTGIVAQWNFNETSNNSAANNAANGPTPTTVPCLANGNGCTTASQCCTGNCTTFYQDSDSDGYGNASLPTTRCGTTYSGYVTNNTDCDDTTNTRWATRTCYYDRDADTYGTTSSSSMCKGASCAAPSDANYYNSSVNTDCYDADPSTTNAELAHPGQTTCYTTNRGDGSFDYDCSGTATTCISPCYAGDLGVVARAYYGCSFAQRTSGATAACGAAGATKTYTLDTCTSPAACPQTGDSFVCTMWDQAGDWQCTQSCK